MEISGAIPAGKPFTFKIFKPQFPLLSIGGITKRCRLSWLTNSALVYEPKCGGTRGHAGSQPMSTAEYMCTFPARESLVSAIPAGDGKFSNLFLQCRGFGVYSMNKTGRWRTLSVTCVNAASGVSSCSAPTQVPVST
jgi:hypothetical protein